MKRSTLLTALAVAGSVALAAVLAIPLADAGGKKMPATDEARAAYLAALEKKYAGDEGGALKSLEDVARRWPDTLYGKRAAAEVSREVSRLPAGTLSLPMMAGGLAWFTLMRGFDASPPPPHISPGPPPPVPSTDPPTAEAKKMAKKARSLLESLKKASLAYFEEEHKLSDGTPLPKQFPETTSVTPPTLYCGKYGTKPDKKVFSDNPTWAALGFTPDPGLPFQYSYRADGQDEFAWFEITITGDIDCDSVTSSFTIKGRTEGTLTPSITGPDVYNEFE